MRNPVYNAVDLTPIRRLVSCNRCGAPNLAWVCPKKTSRWYLANTSTLRPFYRGENQNPEAPEGFVYALKISAHNCALYREKIHKDAAELENLRAYQLIWRNENGHTAVEMLQKALVNVWLYDCENKSNPPCWIQDALADIANRISLV